MKIAAIEDIPRIVEFIRQFIEESGWGFSHDAAVSTLQLIQNIEYPDADVIVSEAGFAVVLADQDFCKERIGFLNKFYIAKEHRRTTAGRELAQAVVNWFDTHGCYVSYATSTSMIPGAICAFTNLMRKYGYETCGPTLVRHVQV